MNNFDKLKFLLKKYDEIFNETNSLRNDNNSEKNEELIKSYDRHHIFFHKFYKIPLRDILIVTLRYTVS